MVLHTVGPGEETRESAVSVDELCLRVEKGTFHTKRLLVALAVPQPCA